MTPTTFTLSALLGLLASTVSASFDAASSSNVAVYWGQGNAQISLSEVCNDDSIDIVNIAFVNQFPKAIGEYPATNFANACGDAYYSYPNGTQSLLLSHCPGIEPGINTCHANGKKVLLSIGGGWPTDYYLPSKEVAEYFAEFLWGAFGPVTQAWKDANKPRPFGDASVDGFDLDIESYMVTPPYPDYQYANYDHFVSKLKEDLFPTGPSTYYISGAPQCIIPDVRLTDAISKSHFDFIFAQFYNTPECSAQAGYNGLNALTTTFTFNNWAAWLKANSANPNVKLYLGLPAGPNGAPSDTASYLTPTEANDLVTFYKGEQSDIFGGVMLWEATVSSRNTICGKGYSSYIKNILSGSYIDEVCPSSSASSSIVLSTSSIASSTSSSVIATPTAVSPDGTCGPKTGYTCVGSQFGNCCSEYGYCGKTEIYCSAGCQPLFGKCGLESSSSISSTVSPSSIISSTGSSSIIPTISSSLLTPSSTIINSSSILIPTSTSSTMIYGTGSSSTASSVSSSVLSSAGLNSTSTPFQTSMSSSITATGTSSIASSSASSELYPTTANSTSFPMSMGISSDIHHGTGSSSVAPISSSSAPFPTSANSTLPYSVGTSSSIVSTEGSITATISTPVGTSSSILNTSSSSFISGAVTSSTVYSSPSSVDLPYPTSNTSSSPVLSTPGYTNVTTPCSTSTAGLPASTPSTPADYTYSSLPSAPNAASSTPCSTSVPIHRSSKAPDHTASSVSTAYAVNSVSSSSASKAASSTSCSTSSNNSSATAFSDHPIHPITSTSSLEFYGPSTLDKNTGHLSSPPTAHPSHPAAGSTSSQRTHITHPSVPSHATPTTTIYTTTYVDICPTGFTTQTATITKTLCPACATHAPNSTSDDIEEGWTTTVTVCMHCGPSTTTVTLTKPINTPTGVSEGDASTGTPAYAFSSANKVYGSHSMSGALPSAYFKSSASTSAMPARTLEETITSKVYVTLTAIAVPSTEVPTTDVPRAYTATNGTATGVPGGYASGTASKSGYIPSQTPAVFKGAAEKIGVKVGGIMLLFLGLGLL